MVCPGLVARRHLMGPLRDSSELGFRSKAPRIGCDLNATNSLTDMEG